MWANHYHLKLSLFRIHVENPDCDCGYAQQGLNHILWNSLICDKERKIFVTKLRKSNQFALYIISSFLGTSNLIIIRIICEVLEKCNLNAYAAV